MLWALMEVFRRNGLQVQSFLSRAHFPEYQSAATITGLTPRHLDSWLMSPQACREVLVRSQQVSDVALVEGKFASAVHQRDGGGNLETLCRWLDLPRLVMLDVSRIGSCSFPNRPEEVDGLLLDQVTDVRHLAQLTTELEALWEVPVVGSLERLPGLRAHFRHLPLGTRPPLALCRELGDRFVRFWHPEPLEAMVFGR